MVGWWGRRGVPCPVFNPMVGVATPPARKPAPFASTGCCCCPARRRERRDSPPLLQGPSLDSGEGKETRQGEARSNTNQQPCLCLCLILKRRMLNLKRVARVCGSGRQESGWGGVPRRWLCACETKPYVPARG